MSDLTALNSSAFEVELFNARLRVQDLRRLHLRHVRAGAPSRTSAKQLAAAESVLVPIEAEWWSRYTGGRE